MPPPLPESDSASVELVTNQLLLLATVVGSIAALPALIQFIVEWRKRRERLDLAIEDGPAVMPGTMPVKLVGLALLQNDIADLVDRVAHSDHYRGLTLGNEILIVGPEQGGRRTLAKWIAQQAGIPRIITVHNPRSPDALAATKRLVRRSSGKLMLLLPNIDDVFDDPPQDVDEEIQAELDALVETVASSSNVLVVGTAKSLAEGDDLDNLFGMKIMMPGAAHVSVRSSAQRPQPGSDHERFLREVAAAAVHDALSEGFTLEGLNLDGAIAQIMARVANPAEIEDIVEAAQTSAIYLQRSGKAAALAITPAVLEKAVRRVMGT